MAALIAVAVAAAALVAAHTSGAAAGRTVICGQMKGPYVVWGETTPFGTSHYKGSTWTILASDVSCARAKVMAPAMLRAWAEPRARRSATLNGWRCDKVPAAFYVGKRGGISCFRLTASGAGPSVGLWMYAPLTLAQIKKMLRIG
jgi:hypothetical protein